MSKERYPYQLFLPKAFLKNTITKPVSNGYPPVRQVKIKNNIEEEKAEELLKELGVTKTAAAFLKLLQDPEKLDEVVRKLKLRMFM